ncbi:MAG: carbohydrate kinase family protein [Candidatus Thorarchaeota archaeon]|nr:carbohydrate kinase family protein [Candidatus Thorarchaeota archaeon]
MAGEVVVIGRINTDVVMRIESLPGPNDHFITDEGYISFGGSACNFATQSARLGVPTSLVSCIGNDLYGRLALKELSQIGIDTSQILVLDQQSTGIFFLAEQPNGTGFVFTEPGANRFLEKHIFDEEAIAKARIVHMAGGFPMMNGRALEVATLNGMIFSLDPGRVAGNLDFPKVLAKTDLFFVNEKELKTYFDTTPTEKSLKMFAKNFPGIVIVKRGKKGAIATDGFEYCTSQAFEVKAVDTLGAGDAFAAGFVTAWTRSENIEKALHVGNAVSALTITKQGAQNGQPTLKEVSKLLKDNGVSIDAILRTFGERKRRKKRYNK